jgi:hypothetical protein
MSTSEQEPLINRKPDREPRVLRPVFGDVVLSPPHGSSPMLVMGISDDGEYVDGIRIAEENGNVQLGLPGSIRVEDVVEIIGHKDRLEVASLVAHKLETTNSPYEQTLKEILDQNPEE